MNILLVSAGNFFSSYGGGQVYVKNLVDELVRQGIHPIIATPGNPGDVPGNYSGCIVHTFAQGAGEAELKALLNNIKPDVVHAHGHKAGFSSACAALDIPCIVTAHHGGILCPAGTLLNHRDKICGRQANDRNCLPCVLKNIKGGLYSWRILRALPHSFRLRVGCWIKKLPFVYYVSPVAFASLSIEWKIQEWQTIYQKAHLLVAPSHAIAESMVRNGAPKEKIFVMPHGIPLPETAVPPTSMAVEENEVHPFRFFFVGRICHVKGVHLMLEAFERLTGPAELHIFGGAGNKKEQRYMKRLTKRYQSNQRIAWHGKIAPNRVSDLTARYDVMIHPTILLEVFGLNIAEALALGKPVIATRCGGAEMQIENDVNGWLVEPNDRETLFVAMQKVVSTPIISIRQFGRAALPTVKPICNHVSQLKCLYERVSFNMCI